MRFLVQFHISLQSGLCIALASTSLHGKSISYVLPSMKGCCHWHVAVFDAAEVSQLHKHIMASQLQLTAPGQQQQQSQLGTGSLASGHLDFLSSRAQFDLYINHVLS